MYNVGRQFVRHLHTGGKLRNVGIIAHIDAGKTTTTERMLYYGGSTKHLGDVDHGDTVTDYLPAERARGITITSAAVTLKWNNHKINLIDTPGHADFSFEVTRSIRVLDGAIAILDAVAGVEAQTEKVWSQAQKMNIPGLIYVNKMDRDGAGFGRTVREVVSKLKTKVAIVNIPYYSKKKEFCGVIDVIHKRVLSWENDKTGKTVSVTEVTENEYEECKKARTALIEALGDDEELIEELLQHDDYMALSSETIQKVLRHKTLNMEISPVLCGASFKNIGVQPLLDAAVDYLPSPAEVPMPKAQIHEGQVLNVQEISSMSLALAFKAVKDPVRGMLVYVRVYSGSLTPGTKVLNTANRSQERISKIYQVQADSYTEIKSLEAGNIGVLYGSKDIRTGDTLLSHKTKKDGVNSLPKKLQTTKLDAIELPPPVFFSTIDPVSLSDKGKMDTALDILLKEDPSLTLQVDPESNQTFLSGLGELHLEIARDRLINDLGANIVMGDIMISYKETISQHSEVIEEDATIETKSGPSIAKVRLSVGIFVEGDDMKLFHPENNYIKYSCSISHPVLSQAEIVDAVTKGLYPAISRGGKKNLYPLYSLCVDIEEIDIPVEVASAVAVTEAARNALKQAIDSLDVAAFDVIEPIMTVEISVPSQYLGVIVPDVTSARQGQVESIEDGDSSDGQDAFYKDLAREIYTPPDDTMHLSQHGGSGLSLPSLVVAKVPLRNMVGYLTRLRSMTKGTGTFIMSFSHYDKLA